MLKNNANKLISTSLLIIAFLIFIVANIISINFFAPISFDLTENKIFTLSKGSKNILDKIEEPITLKFYFSKNLAKNTPYLLSFGKRVQDLLTQYQRQAKGKINVQILEPEPFTEIEDEAVNAGLQGIPVDNEGNELYIGLVGTNSIDSIEVLPLISPEREANLEYDISQLIYNLINIENNFVGILSSLALEGQMDLHRLQDPRSNAVPWAIYEQLHQAFEVEILDADTDSIAKKINTLLIVNPIMLTENALQAVDDFVMRGGHIILFVDPFSEIMDANTKLIYTENKTEYADFNQLLNKWGIELIPNKVVAYRENAKMVRAVVDNKEQTLRYAFWMDFDAQNFNANDVLMNGLEKITLATPGALRASSGASTNFQPLIWTSKDAMLVDLEQVEKYQKNPRQLLLDYTPSGSYTVAARLSGPIHSLFSERSVEDSNIVVISDADMLYDHFWLSVQKIYGQTMGVPIAGNANLVLSALDNLSGSNDLISIRNRSNFSRPFSKINEIELASNNKFRDLEIELVNKIEHAKEKLKGLNQEQDASTSLLDISSRQERENFKNEILGLRKQLRDVRHKLNADIQRMESWIKFLVIGLMPLLISLIGLSLWIFKTPRKCK